MHLQLLSSLQNVWHFIVVAEHLCDSVKLRTRFLCDFLAGNSTGLSFDLSATQRFLGGGFSVFLADKGFTLQVNLVGGPYLAPLVRLSPNGGR